MSTTVIVGGGQAGGRCAMTLRSKGYEGRVVLIGGEPHPPYRRPPLSKTVLLGKDSVVNGYFRPVDEYEENDIELQLEQRVAEIGLEGRFVRYESGETRRFDNLVLATGATPRPLSVPGHDLEGVCMLRTAADAEAIRARLETGRRIAIVGGGFIGLEVASSARQRGCDVVVLEALDRVLSRSVPAEAAEAVADVHRREGVEIKSGVSIEAFRGNGGLEEIALAGGETIQADTAVVGIGIVPDTRLAADAGIEVSNGIVADEYGRASVDGIYAAGDCASVFIPRYGRHIRLESFQNADQQGMNVAATIAGQPAGYDPVPFVWSDQYQRVLQTAGFPVNGDRHVQRGSVDGEDMVLFSLEAGRLVGVTGWGNGRLIAKDVRFAQRLIQQDARPDLERLADPGIPVKDLAPGH